MTNLIKNPTPRWTWGATAAAACLAVSAGVGAQDTAATIESAVDSATTALTTRASLIPEGAAWGMVLDPAVIRRSPIVQQTLAEVPEAQRERWVQRVDDFSQIVGMNLRQDLGRVVAFGHGFDPASVAVAADLGPKETNLEGLLLAGDQYESYDYADLLIHSVQEGNDRPRIFCAILPSAAQRSGLLLASPAAALTESLIDDARLGAALSGPDTLAEDEFLRLWINQLPQDMLPENSRQSNIARMIDTIELVGTTGQQGSALDLQLHTVSPARARMLTQMASGFKAIIQFAAADDVEAQKLADLLAYVSITQVGETATVSVRGEVTSEDVGAALDALGRTGFFKEIGLD